MEKIDKLDRQILNIISKNARIPFKDVAEECGVSRAAIHQRVQVILYIMRPIQHPRGEMLHHHIACSRHFERQHTHLGSEINGLFTDDFIQGFLTRPYNL